VATKPWDGRLAFLLIRPLRHTRVTPNHLTTAGLLVGLAAALLYADGGPLAASLGGLLYCLSAVLDHADGELARLTGRTSAAGHAYDRVADLIVKVCLFAGIGAGFRDGPLGWWGPVLGLTAGVAFVTIFVLRSEIARRLGAAALEQPRAGAFEVEDILYVIAPLTWIGWLQPFLVAAAAGAPLFALWVATRLRAAVRAPVGVPVAAGTAGLEPHIEREAERWAPP
jgi:phosphatidylglycerophosphate synthase